MKIYYVYVMSSLTYISPCFTTPGVMMRERRKNSSGRRIMLSYLLISYLLVVSIDVEDVTEDLEEVMCCLVYCLLPIVL